MGKPLLLNPYNNALFVFLMQLPNDLMYTVVVRVVFFFILFQFTVDTFMHVVRRIYNGKSRWWRSGINLTRPWCISWYSKHFSEMKVDTIKYCWSTFSASQILLPECGLASTYNAAAVSGVLCKGLVIMKPTMESLAYVDELKLVCSGIANVPAIHILVYKCVQHLVFVLFYFNSYFLRIIFLPSIYISEKSGIINFGDDSPLWWLVQKQWEWVRPGPWAFS